MSWQFRSDGERFMPTQGRCQAVQEDGRQCVYHFDHDGDHSATFERGMSDSIGPASVAVVAPMMPVPNESPLTTRPAYFTTITSRTVLTSSQALSALWALRHYRTWLESDATRAWPRPLLSDHHREINDAIHAIESAGHDAG